MDDDISRKLFAEAQRVIPGGVNSPVRAWKAVGGSPRFIQRAKGSTITDVDGRTYIDYVGSWGPMILGHAHPKVLQAVRNALREGTSFGAPTAREVELAQRLIAAIPSLEKVRLVSSGTEATMTALRLARAFTGRSKILKFAGCYHGHSDALLVRAGSGALTFGVPDSPGVPEALASQTLIAAYNNLDQVRAWFDAEGRALAAVIVEPIAGNMGVVLPEPGFLEGLRDLTDQHGALLIFDEVITGFRLLYGGIQNRFGLRPDLTCLGKIVGGGLPLAAVGGRADIMDQLAPVGPVYQAGTLSGNPLAVAAGLATLAQLEKRGVYERLEGLGQRLEQGLVGALRRHNTRACVNRIGSMLTMFFGVDAVRDLDSAGACDTQRFGRFFGAVLERGVYLSPSAFEALFVSLAHSEADIDFTVQAADEALGGM
ncbi:MAG: glutamate-1-semialdehyde-2,1-aminomutase [Acidobacteria bacterium RBG_16_68_9]|nr:MAG: glutamate-1-semialdehyde-2,1-aminomutase [Acidobacteria bacterium RBG_16_68_9]